MFQQSLTSNRKSIPWPLAGHPKKTITSEKQALQSMILLYLAVASSDDTNKDASFIKKEAIWGGYSSIRKFEMADGDPSDKKPDHGPSRMSHELDVHEKKPEIGSASMSELATEGGKKPCHDPGVMGHITDKHEETLDKTKELEKEGKGKPKSASDDVCPESSTSSDPNKKPSHGPSKPDLEK